MSIFEIHMRSLDKKNVNLFIMCSNENIEDTKKFFEENNYFGHKKELVHFFIQSDLPLLQLDGVTSLKVKGKVKRASSGHRSCI